MIVLVAEASVEAGYLFVLTAAAARTACRMGSMRMRPGACRGRFLALLCRNRLFMVMDTAAAVACLACRRCRMSGMLFVFRHDFSPVSEVVVMEFSEFSSHGDVASTAKQPMLTHGRHELENCSVRDHSHS